MSVQMQILIQDCIAHLQHLKKVAADFRTLNIAGREFLRTAFKTPMDSTYYMESFSSLPSACGPKAHSGKSEPGGKAPGKFSALAFSYLQYKIIEALQPHPAYEFDDGFQPLEVIQSMSFDDDPAAQQALAEFGPGDLPVMDVLAAMLENETVIRTGYEPCNGDVMVGLPENLGRRQLARVERERLVVGLAAKYSLQVKWNEDRTGRLETSHGDPAEPCGSVWKLLSYLHSLEASTREIPKRLN